MDTRDEHLPEIDWLKGFAILSVICIHAAFTAESWFFFQIVNRAVHVFLVLFGMSAELWWRRELARAPEHATRRWYWGRLRRMVPGYWAMTVAWWLVVVLWRRPPGDAELGPVQALLSFTGYAPWIGTTWFVAIILQLVLIFPFLRRAIGALGAPLSLIVAAAATFASCWFIGQIVAVGKSLLGNNVPSPGWYYQWIFVPRVLWDVTAGILIVRWWRGRVSRAATLIALLLTLLLVFVTKVVRGGSSDFLGPAGEMAMAHITDVPLSVALLGAFRWVRLPSAVRAFLAWCGAWSWGIYLGHLLLHELVQIAGHRPFLADQWTRAGYALGLLAGGAALAVLASRIDAAGRRSK